MAQISSIWLFTAFDLDQGFQAKSAAIKNTSQGAMYHLGLN